MLLQALIISFIVLFIYKTMDEGMIFEKLGNWFKENLPEEIHMPVFNCPICMTPWYGTIIYFILFYHGEFIWRDYLGTIFAAGGISVIFAVLLHIETAISNRFEKQEE